jgi:chromosome segregation ATPase
MRSLRRDRFDVQFSQDFEERVTQRLLTLVSKQLGSLSIQVAHIERKVDNLMATAQDVKGNIERLKTDVADQKTVIASVRTLIDGQVAQMRALSDQIAALQADNLDQTEIDELAASAKQAADDLEANTAELASKVPQNTPAEGQPA